MARNVGQKVQWVGVGAVVGAGAVFTLMSFLWSGTRQDLAICKDDLAKAQAATAGCREEQGRLREKFEKELAEAKAVLTQCQSRLIDCQRDLDLCRRPPKLGCSVTHPASGVGPRTVRVTVVGASTNTNRLFAAAEVFDGRGRSWWPSELIDNRDGARDATVHIGAIPPGGYIKAVVLRELRPGFLVLGRPFAANAAFEVLCTEDRSSLE